MTHHEGGTRPQRKRPRPTYHRIKCNVCSHPDRAAIDEAFLRWESPEKLAHRFGLQNHTSIYRHVHATGLFARRRRKLSWTLESIVEQAGRVFLTVTDVFKAVKMYAHLNDQGERIVPARTQIIRRFSSPAEENCASNPKINRKPGFIENAATH